jgi:hypothetical protein
MDRKTSRGRSVVSVTRSAMVCLNLAHAAQAKNTKSAAA